MPKNKGIASERRTRGEHLERRKVKTAIIKFILRSPEAVLEPDIREFLRKKYEILDQGNIKKHLRDLQTLPYCCIEKIPPKRGFANKWDIKKVENLKNLKLYFPEIPLNIYQKFINIVFKERYSDIGFFTSPDEFRTQLLLSSSFLDMCIKTDMLTLYQKTYEMDQFGEGFDRHQRIKKYINEVYTECMKNIPVNSNIWLTIYDECISDSLKSDVLRNLLKSSPKPNKISEEEFRKILDIIPFALSGEESEEKWYQFIVERISNIITLDISAEMLIKSIEDRQNIPEEIFEKIQYETYKRISGLISKGMTSENSEEIYNKILEIKFNQRLCISMIPHIFFEHCFQRDIVDDTASPEEKEFMYEVKKFHAWFNKEADRDLEVALQAKEEFYTECFNRYSKKIMIQ